MTALGTVEILERLVGFPTVSRDSNMPLIDWVRNYLADFGIESHLVPNSAGGKANLFASVGPPEEGGLVLSGHTDVVPVDGQPWSSDPFKLAAREARLHARGACDMKGYIAAALSRVPSLKAQKLQRPVHFMFSYDEEIGCLGAPSLIAAASRKLPKPAVVIVGEPTGMAVANTHKGICAGRTRVTGIEAHSSLTHQGVSAVMLAAELIHHLNEAAAKLARETVTSGSSRFVPPYGTVTANMIQGGTASNIMAGACEFAWDIRALPGESAHAVIDSLNTLSSTLLARLESEGRRCSIRSEVLADVPPLIADGGMAEQLARAVTLVTGDSITVPFATEGGQFQRAGWSTVVCGPGSIEQAHRADEYVERAQLAACETFLDRAIARQCMS